MKKLVVVFMALVLSYVISITAFANGNNGAALGASGTLGGSGSSYSSSSSTDGTTKPDRNIHGSKNAENQQHNGSARPPKPGDAHPNPDTGGSRVQLPYAVRLKD